MEFAFHQSACTWEGNPEFPQNGSTGFLALYRKQTFPVWGFPLWGIHSGCSLAGYSKYLWDFLFGKFPSSHFAILQVQFTSTTISLLPFKLPLRLNLLLCLVSALISEVTLFDEKGPCFLNCAMRETWAKKKNKNLFCDDCSFPAFPHFAQSKRALVVIPAAQLVPHQFQDKQETALSPAFDFPKMLPVEAGFEIFFFSSLSKWEGWGLLLATHEILQSKKHYIRCSSRTNPMWSESWSTVCLLNWDACQRQDLKPYI